MHEPQNPANVNLPAMKLENRFQTRITAFRASVMINLVLRSMFSIVRATLKIIFKKDQNRLVNHEFILDFPSSATQPIIIVPNGHLQKIIYAVQLDQLRPIII